MELDGILPKVPDVQTNKGSYNVAAYEELPKAARERAAERFGKDSREFASYEEMQKVERERFAKNVLFHGAHHAPICGFDERVHQKMREGLRTPTMVSPDSPISKKIAKIRR